MERDSSQMIQSVDQSTAVLVAVSFICVAGIGMTAATIDAANPVGADEGDPVVNPPSPRDAVDVGGSTGAGTGENSRGGTQVGQSYATLTTCVPFLDSTVGLLSVLAVVLAISGVIYYRFNFALALFAGWTILPPMMLGYFLTTDCGTSSGSLLGDAASGALGTSGKGPVGVGQVPPWVMLLFGVLVTGGAVALLYRSSGSEEIVVSQEKTSAEEVELDDFAAAAGRAADRIEEHDQDADNAVYQAWVEMTSLLDVESPETYSPGEFADEAVEAGMDQDDVRELTRLFNEVRYGEREVDPRGNRAVDVLRNIEQEYSSPANPDDSDAITADDRTTNMETDPDDEPSDGEVDR